MSITAFIPVIGKILDRVIPDKNARRVAEEAMMQAAQSGELQLLMGQLEINKIEAASGTWFVAGWRPATGWICAAGLLYNVLLSPFLDIWFEIPVVDPALLYPVLLGMLGLSGSRSFEKSRGVARD